MSAYPSHNVLLESSFTAEDEFEDDVAQTGTGHSRQMRSQTWYQIELVHVMTMSEFQTLEEFYDNEPRDAHTVDYYGGSPAVTFSAKFTEKPRITENLGAGQFKVISRMRGTQS